MTDPKSPKNRDFYPDNFCQILSGNDSIIPKIQFLSGPRIRHIVYWIFLLFFAFFAFPGRFLSIAQ
ncbi:hypothetical protein BYT27DRAFT_6401863 [Phlegmacium glaucopus]|nr:hypothetical protein BYT27DRAFT_6401863 [Phlegmacium glaucopus]